MKRALRRLGLLVAASTSTLLMSLALAPSAAALPCPGSDHCYALGTFTSGLNDYTGGFMSTNANFMTPGEGSVGGFINSEMWILPASQDGWVEAGLTNGIVADGPIGYSAFFAYFRPGTTNPYREQVIEYSTPTGTTRSFQISRGSSFGAWTVRYNGEPRGFTPNMGWWTNRRIDVGAELLSTDSDARADTFNMSARLFTTSGQPVLVPNLTDFRDFPCPQTGCFNGVPGNSSYSWNKARG